MEVAIKEVFIKEEWEKTQKQHKLEFELEQATRLKPSFEKMNVPSEEDMLGSAIPTMRGL